MCMYVCVCVCVCVCIGVGRLSLLQGIFPTQGSYLGLPHCSQTLYQLSHKGSPCTYIYIYATNIRAPKYIIQLNTDIGGGMGEGE